MNIPSNLNAMLQNAKLKAVGNASTAGAQTTQQNTTAIQTAMNSYVGAGNAGTALRSDVQQFAKDVVGLVDPNKLQTAVNSVNVDQFKTAIQSKDPAQLQNAVKSLDTGAIRDAVSSIDMNKLRDLESFQNIQNTFRVESDKQINTILQKRPLSPTNQNMFSPAAYPGASPLTPATGPAPTEKQAGQMLTNYLKDEFPMNPQARKEAEALFINPDLVARIPNPSLRAGLLGLSGTAGQPAIDFYLNSKTEAGLPKVNIVGFDDNPWDPTDAGVARSVVDPTTQQMSVVFNPKYKNENPFQFSSFLAHEALHSDATVAGNEEVTALAIQSSIYLEQLSQHPELAKANTELTRRSNTNALTRLNSGTGTELGLFASNGNKPILPGSPLPFTSWYGQFQNQQLADTPGNPLLGKYLANMAKPGSTVPQNPNFDMNTLTFIDQNSANLSRRDIVAAAKALKLQV